MCVLKVNAERERVAMVVPIGHAKAVMARLLAAAAAGKGETGLVSVLRPDEEKAERYCTKSIERLEKKPFPTALHCLMLASSTLRAHTLLPPSLSQTPVPPALTEIAKVQFSIALPSRLYLQVVDPSSPVDFVSCLPRQSTAASEVRCGVRYLSHTGAPLPLPPPTNRMRASLSPPGISGRDSACVRTAREGHAISLCDES